MKSKLNRYHWVIVFASTVIIAFSMGMVHSTNSLFVKPICSEFGFTRAEYTLAEQ